MYEVTSSGERLVGTPHKDFHIVCGENPGGEVYPKSPSKNGGRPIVRDGSGKIVLLPINKWKPVPAEPIMHRGKSYKKKRSGYKESCYCVDWKKMVLKRSHKTKKGLRRFF